MIKRDRRRCVRCHCICHCVCACHCARACLSLCAANTSRFQGSTRASRATSTVQGAPRQRAVTASRGPRVVVRAECNDVSSPPSSPSQAPPGASHSGHTTLDPRHTHGRLRRHQRVAVPVVVHQLAVGGAAAVVADCQSLPPGRPAVPHPPPARGPVDHRARHLAARARRHRPRPPRQPRLRPRRHRLARHPRQGVELLPDLPQQRRRAGRRRGQARLWHRPLEAARRKVPRRQRVGGRRARRLCGRRGRRGRGRRREPVRAPCLHPPSTANPPAPPSCSPTPPRSASTRPASRRTSPPPPTRPSTSPPTSPRPPAAAPTPPTRAPTPRATSTPASSCSSSTPCTSCRATTSGTTPASSSP